MMAKRETLAGPQAFGRTDRIKLVSGKYTAEEAEPRYATLEFAIASSGRHFSPYDLLSV